MPFGTQSTTDRWRIGSTPLSFGYKAVVVDSILLLLLAVGLWNPHAIARQKRLNGFTVGDFELLQIFLSSFNRVITSAHVLSEVSNLAGAASGQTKDAIFIQFAAMLEILEERTTQAVVLSKLAEFRIFGLTDTALAELSSQALLITQDGRLAAHLQSRGLSVLTLHDIRALRDQANNA